MENRKAQENGQCPEPAFKPWATARKVSSPRLISLPSRQRDGHGDRFATDSTEDECINVRMLGTFSLSIGDRIVPEREWPLRKVKALVKLLALAPGNQLHREQALELLWPDLEPESAANNLYKVLHRARRVLEPGLPPKQASSFLHLQGDIIHLDRIRSIDIEDFRAAAAAARLSHDPDLYEEALGLYVGDLLSEDRYEDWAIAPREELRGLWFTLLLEVADIWERRGDIDRAVQALQQVVASDAAHEEATVALMRMLAGSGRRRLALRQYIVLRDALRRELDAEPDSALQTLFEQIRSGQRLSPAPALRTKVELNSEEPPFIGRDIVLDDCKARLQALEGGRGDFVIVRGDVGAGKTRLLHEIASRAAELGIVVLWAPTHSEEGRPYDTLACALERLTSRLSSADLRVLLGDLGPEICRILPAVRPVLKAQGFGLEQPDRLRLYGTVAEVFGSLARRSPILFLVDDLDKADVASLDLFHHLRQTILNSSVLFMGTATSGVGAPVEYRVLEEIARVIDLKPLNRGETAQVVRAALAGEIDGEIPEAVYQVARGNPFYTVEAVRALLGRGYFIRRAGSWILRDSSLPRLHGMRLRTRAAR